MASDNTKFGEFRCNTRYERAFEGQKWGQGNLKVDEVAGQKEIHTSIFLNATFFVVVLLDPP